MSKQPDLENEVHRLQHAVQSLTAQLQTEVERNRSLERQISASAQTDVLTRASSLRAIMDASEMEHARSSRYGTPYAATSVELSNFMSIVEVHGHAAADKALTQFVTLARKCIRDGVDLIGRNGHQEFCILMPQTDVTGARQSAQRIRQMAKSEPLTQNNIQIFMEPLFGIATYSGGSETSATDVMNMARSARMKARSGENGTAIITTNADSISADTRRINQR